MDEVQGPSRRGPVGASHLTRRGWLLTAIFLLVLGCTSSANDPEGGPQQEHKESYGSGLDQALASIGPNEQPDPDGGKLVVTLVDHNDQHPQGIPVAVSGPVNSGLLSDAKGRVEVTGPPGEYMVDVETGCTGDVVVLSGEGGSATLVAGSVGETSLKVAWKHRVAPGFGAYPSRSPNWYLAETIDIFYDVLDRCSNDKAPGARFDTWKFKTSPNLGVVGTPVMIADHKAQGLVRVRCRTSGEAELVAFDSKNRGDAFDLIDYILFQGTIRCANSPE